VKRKRLSVAVGAVAALATMLSLNGMAVGAPTASDTVDRSTAEYVISGIKTLANRSAVAETGAAVNYAEHGMMSVTATAAEAAKIRSLGFTVELDVPPQTAATEGEVNPQDFPPADSGFHNFAEMTAELNQAVTDHPGLISKQVIGRSYQNREIVAIKISDNVGVDENEPEVLFTHHQHAREHLTVEMALYLVRVLTDEYATTQRIKNIVDSREIWIVPDMNPDGGEYDISTGSYAGWRKNRQPNSGSSYIGTDMNRNWAYKWGCCGGSSGSTSSDTYRGPSAESSPEVKVVADFTRSRRINNVQQIKTHIDFHTFSELILWPMGYTYSNTSPELNAADEAVFRLLGQRMASTNGYTPEQASDLYITDGTIDDWMWASQGIWSYTYEMYPSSGGLSGFYPPDEQIGPQTTRIREAVLTFIEYSDCVRRINGGTCDGTPPPPGQVFENLNNVNIADNTTVFSNVVVSGLTGNAPTNLAVGVDIKHTYRGDLVIDLVAPDGSLYRLKNSSGSDSADNVIATYTVNASTEVANGTWQLRVQDVYSGDTGYIDAFRLTFP